MRRFSRATNQLLLSGTLAATAALALGFAGCSSEEGTTATCISTQERFARVYFAVMKDKCASCHQLGSVGSINSEFDLRASSEAGYLEANMEVVRQLAKTVNGEKSIFLQKPVGGLGHEGGKVLAEDSAEFRELEDLVDKLANDDTGCPNTEARFLSGVELMNPSDTLRKASLVLASRLPTAEEEAAVKKGGFEALDGVMDKLMEEEAFYTRLEEKFNDVMHTDFYVNEGLGAFGGDDDENQGPYDPFYYLNIPDTAANRLKYGVPPEADFYEWLDARVREGVGRQPLKLVSYIVRNNRPYTEIANANYMVVNPFSAPAYRITDVTFQNDADPYEWQAARIGGYDQGYPHAGIMSDLVWLARHPTTPTNRNRHRAKEAMYLFLANDILKAAERPIDITAVQRAQNPTVNDGNCSQCHVQVDEIAGGFRNFQSDDPDAPVFMFDSEFGWYDEMWQPGFKGVNMPPSVYSNALPWTMNMIAQDPGMAFGGVYMAFRTFVGSEPLAAPSDPKDPDYQADLSAYLGQYYTISKIAENFRVKHGYNFKKMVKEVVMSPYFRAKNTAGDISDVQLSHLGGVGSAHLLTPEQLNRKLENVLGMPWGDWDDPNLLREYNLLYGGIDSVDTTVRVTDPNGVMANIVERMSLEAGCEVIAAEFSIPQAERRLFTSVEHNLEPMDANGYEIPENAAKIKANIVHLHQYLLGETLAVTDPEIERTYRLFVETWQEGKPLASKPGDEGGLGGGFRCGINHNYITGVPFGETAEGDKSPHVQFRGDGEGGSRDQLYVARAWMAVMVYMLTDANFVYEL